MEIIKDNIFLAKKNALRSTISFLKAIKSRMPEKLAIELANEAANNFMIGVYEDVFKNTAPYSQARFDAFRTFYEAHPKTSPYCEIIESTSSCLKVRFYRCPHAEILQSENLFEFAQSSCLSDVAFTSKLLPGVEFKRESSIVDGDSTCVMKWEKLNKDKS